MGYAEAVAELITINGVELSTMMNTPCLRYRGAFFAMYFDKADALIIKIAPERVNQLIAEGEGVEFNLTGKRFREWVMIPVEHEARYAALIGEALDYAKSK